MPRDIFSISPSANLFGGSRQKKRKNISFTKKAILWEKDKRHICHICKQKIHSQTEAQVDHVRAFSKGGQKIAWAHSACNRMKGNKPLSKIQKELGIYKPKKRAKKKRTSRRISNPLGLRPIKISGFRF
jgi:hypothetical protein